MARREQNEALLLRSKERTAAHSSAPAPDFTISVNAASKSCALATFTTSKRRPRVSAASSITRNSRSNVGL